MRHYQALVRLDTADPPGNETRAVDYVRRVLEAEGIPVIVTARDPGRGNLIARLKGNGSRRPLLVMGHTDTVKVDPSKWSHPPFSAARDGGYIYGRGTLALISLDKRENFMLDVTRAQIKPTKITFRNRARQAIILMRLDLDGPQHRMVARAD